MTLNGKRVELVILHQNPLLRDCLALGLTTYPEYTLLGAWHPAEIDLIPDHVAPTIILLDAAAHIGDHADALTIVNSYYPDACIVLLGSSHYDPSPTLITKHNVKAFVAETYSLNVIHQVVTLVAQGLCVYDPLVIHVSTSMVTEAHVRTEPCMLKLTARERVIVDLIRQGKSNRTIAHDLNITYKTVEGHVTRILRKMNVNSRWDIPRFWN